MNITNWTRSRWPLRIGLAALTALTLALIVPIANGSVWAAAADTDVIVTAVGGDEQQQYAGHLFGQGLQVSVVNQGDVNNGPVANAPVTFAVVEGSASFVGSGSSATATTDSNGMAFSPGIIAGSTPGQVVIAATSSVATASAADFSLTVLPQQPATVTVTNGGGQQANVGTNFAAPVTVVVADMFGDPVPNWPATFTINSAAGGGASFPEGSQSVQVTTAANGSATSPPITATQVGDLTVSVTTGLSGIGNTVELRVNPSPPASATISGGNNQTAVANTAFSQPLSVQVLDGNNQPPQGQVTVLFSVTGGEATFPGGAARVPVSLQDGIATAPPLTAGSVAGAVTVQAEVEDTSIAPVVFSLSVSALAPNQLTASSGGGQSAYTANGFLDPLVAQVLDQNGDPLPNVYVTFTVSGPASFAGQPSQIVVTDANGYATTAALTAGSTSGAVQVSANVAGLQQPAVFAETVLARAAATVQPSAGNNQTAAPGQAFALPLVALVLDQTNTVYPGAPVTFTITGPATFGGQPSTVVTTDANGEAQAIVTAGSTTGTVTVTMAVAGAVDEGGSFTLTVAYPSQVSASAAHPGDTVHVSASGLVPGENVEVWLHSDPVRLVSVAADANGRIDTDVTIPLGTPAGTHQLEIRAAQSGSKFHDIVISPAGAAGALAETGPPIDPAVLVWIGVGLTVAGAIGVRMSRR